MAFATTPVQIIKSSIRAFAHACFLDNAVHEGRITPATFQNQIRLEEDGGDVVLRHTFTEGQIKVETHNLILLTLGNSAVSTNKALEVVYGKEFDPADTTPEGSARVLLYQIRCAFAHDPFNPVWTPKPWLYDQHYRVVVKVNRPNGDLDTRRAITFHPPSLKGMRLHPDHIGGIGGYLGLLHYYLARVQKHEKGNLPYSPSIEES
jgi:hypothetical protein